jgi:hypothetical protein
MTPEKLEDLLNLWGRVFGESGKPKEQEDSSPTGNSPLAAHINTERAVKSSTDGRDGRSRRALMGASVGVRLLDPAFIDPIPCTETRAKQSKEPPDPRMTPLVDTIQGEWLKLCKFFPIQAECVRLQYQVRGMTQSQKSELVVIKERTIGVKRFKDELRAGRHWLDARLTP